ncbi:4-hydroxy-3-methylbut-2-en-1-yl diphosphate synthase [Sulfobacillus acidophilus TPY]|uniref:4-hydroxy-3-methylbut-2-en-1-yl diphosphate synthase (flavodoxin) n=1 Tax=Sulfobacillus acidophilus (strain ATCC 700253 / DSM 10332 / NAL) TaxID=679936 RepID=G8U0U8_SULAD|nr:4-hydroxy-3-methylbut-2-en-1-yl diphosphate synthase [Sulfobacillus acidophilus TPY]AEW05401.1 4-hydroxy-3-methylbut-2-en-1-yl diphosphate synthase [Sulfobacillus acidophilus DSM 10332]
MSKAVKVRDLQIGGGAPVVVQGMTKTDTRDVQATVEEIRRYADVGCEIVRVAVPDMEAAQAVGTIVRQSPIPVVADIHFDYRLALEVIRQGIDKLRLNPGNIGGRDRVEQVVKAAKERGIPIRIGVNSGSIEKGMLQDYGRTAEAMVASAEKHIQILNDLDFDDIVISLKASDVPTMLQAYRLMAARHPYPLHLGVTEAGTVFQGTIKSAIGIGALLAEGIGDTIRVSLTAPGEEEIRVAWQILKSLGLRQRGADIVACPTCGRLQFDMWPVVNELERRLATVAEPLHVAIMGCAVNGPGEAREADVGLAGGKNMGLIFRHGEIVRRVEQEDMVEELWKEIQSAREEARTVGQRAQGNHP